MQSPDYVVITPARDEEKHLAGTIDSMVRQSQRPREWIIVNDGSSDRTGEIADLAAKRHEWIKVVHRKDRGFRAAGSGVMDAFYSGFDQLSSSQWDFLVKFDGDLTFEADYFELCFREFEKAERLGIGGGVIYNRTSRGLILERHPRFHVRGATKIYRRRCWDDIKGLTREVGWDTIDEVKANMLGWSTKSFDQPSLTQERFTGDAAGQWNNWVKNGRASFIIGYHPVYILAKAFARAFRKPYLKASLGLLYGFFKSYGSPASACRERLAMEYLRSQQLRRLVGLPSIWR